MTSPFTDEQLAAMAEGAPPPCDPSDYSEVIVRLAKDARRYRWLRDSAECHRPNKNISDELCYFDLNSSDFEAAIDAAMQEGK